MHYKHQFAQPTRFGTCVQSTSLSIGNNGQKFIAETVEFLAVPLTKNCPHF